MIHNNMLKDFSKIMSNEEYNARFYELWNKIDDIIIDVADDFCKRHHLAGDGIELLNGLTDEELGLVLREVMAAMLDRAGK